MSSLLSDVGLEMDSKSKLPKPSKLRQPTISNTSTANNEPKQGVPRPLQPVVRAPPPVVKPKKWLRRSKSLADLHSNTNPTFAVSASSTSKVGVKRPSATSTSKIDTGTKPKQVKQVKIPDWDYKSRFLNLQEKHTKLLEAHKKIKDQAAGIEELEDQHNTLMSEHETLKKSHETLTLLAENQAAELKYLKQVEIELNELKGPYNDLKIKHAEMCSDMEQFTTENNNLKQTVNELTSQLARLKEDYTKKEILRRKLHNVIQDLKGNIRVFCRVRPPINELENERLKCLIQYPEENSLEISKNANSLNNKQEFSFHYVFNEDSTQTEFFEELSQFVQSAIDGYHVCVFAYGQTGSGKTYTMQGLDTPEHMGMIPRTVNLIFETIENLCQSNWEYEVKVSFLEIYNENVKDLLDRNANLDICFNEGKGTTVTNLKIEPIYSYKDFEQFMKVAQKNRMVAATDFNEHSSRSHAITKIYINGRHGDSKEYYTGSVNLVDLAGSESAKTSHGDRLVETKSINKSLSTLGNVMLALHNKDKHIPYRNSKLTYLLQSCLGGNSKTMMIVNISPFEDNYGESISSLRFASTVKEVRTKIKRNKAIMPLSAINTSNIN